MAIAAQPGYGWMAIAGSPGLGPLRSHALWPIEEVTVKVPQHDRNMTRPSGTIRDHQGPDGSKAMTSNRSRQMSDVFRCIRCQVLPGLKFFQVFFSFWNLRGPGGLPAISSPHTWICRLVARCRQDKAACSIRRQGL